jgi:hypothetical protein
MTAECQIAGADLAQRELSPAGYSSLGWLEPSVIAAIIYFYNFSNRVIARRALIGALVAIRLIRLDASNPHLGAAPRAIWSFHFRFWRIGFELAHAPSGLSATDPVQADNGIYIVYRNWPCFGGPFSLVVSAFREPIEPLGHFPDRKTGGGNRRGVSCSSQSGLPR